MTIRFSCSAHRLRCATVLLLSLIALTTTASARDGSDVFAKTCLLCHGLITERSFWHQYVPRDGSEIKLAVVTPRGPTLNGIVGRPAGIISNYSYSKGMRKFATTGAVWDRDTLDQFLTNSRKFVKGTFMILKLADEDRKLILDYLESIAIYRPKTRSL